MRRVLHARTCVTCFFAGVSHPCLYSLCYATLPGGGLIAMRHSLQRKAALRAGYANGLARCSPMQGRGIRQEVDDEKLYDGCLQCVRQGSLHTICDSIVGPAICFGDKLFAPIVILRALTLWRYPRCFLFFRNLSQFQLEQRPSLYRATMRAGRRCAGDPFM